MILLIRNIIFNYSTEVVVVDFTDIVNARLDDLIKGVFERIRPDIVV